MLLLLVLLFHTVWLTGPAAVVRAHIALSSSATTQTPLAWCTNNNWFIEKERRRVFFYYHNNIIIAIYNCPAPAVIDIIGGMMEARCVIYHHNKRKYGLCWLFSFLLQLLLWLDLLCVFWIEICSTSRSKHRDLFWKTRKLTHANLQNHMSLTNKWDWRIFAVLIIATNYIYYYYLLLWSLFPIWPYIWLVL